MKKNAGKELKIISVSIIFLSAIFLFIGDALAIDGPKRAKLIFSHEDNLNDDNGPGTYTYPSGPVYKSNLHMFDIKNIRIYELGEFYRFDVEYKGKIVRSWPDYIGNRNGWLFNIAEIYIDTDNRWGSGHKNAALGRNVTFPSESYWEKVVFISPVANDIMANEIRNKTDDLEFAESLNDFIFPSNYDVYDYTLSATINKSELGEFSDKWGIQVLSTVFENSSAYKTFYNRRIYKSSSDNDFGGASDLFGAPNVLDIITPVGTSQKDVLSKYFAHPNYSYAKFVVVPMVYKDGKSALNKGDLVAKADGAPLVKDKKMELKIGDIKDGDFNVKETELEVPKESSLPPQVKKTGIAKSVLKDEKVKSYEKADLKFNPEEEDGAAMQSMGTLNLNKSLAGPQSVSDDSLKNNQIASKESKLNKNISDNKNLENKKKSTASKNKKADKYDEFLKKLDQQKLKVKDDEDDSFNDIEKFLAKKETAPIKKSAKGEKFKDFDTDVYEMARIDSKTKILEKPGKKQAEVKKQQDLKISKTVEPVEDSNVETESAAQLKPLIEEPAEEKKDNSIMGRWFGNSKKASKKHAVSDEKKVLSDESMIGIAKDSLPDNSVKNARPETKTVAIEDGGCAANMKKLYAAAEKYLSSNPDARKVSMSMLISAGLIDSSLKCSDGGRYLIEISSAKPKITCINVNNSGHGSYFGK